MAFLSKERTRLYIRPLSPRYLSPTTSSCLARESRTRVRTRVRTRATDTGNSTGRREDLHSEYTSHEEYRSASLIPASCTCIYHSAAAGPIPRSKRRLRPQLRSRSRAGVLRDRESIHRFDNSCRPYSTILSTRLSIPGAGSFGGLTSLSFSRPLSVTLVLRPSGKESWGHNDPSFFPSFLPLIDDDRCACSIDPPSGPVRVLKQTRRRDATLLYRPASTSFRTPSSSSFSSCFLLPAFAPYYYHHLRFSSTWLDCARFLPSVMDTVLAHCVKVD